MAKLEHTPCVRRFPFLKATGTTTVSIAYIFKEETYSMIPIRPILKQLVIFELSSQQLNSVQADDDV